MDGRGGGAVCCYRGEEAAALRVGGPLEGVVQRAAQRKAWWVAPRSALPTVRFANPTARANSCCDKHNPAERNRRIRAGVHSTRAVYLNQDMPPDCPRQGIAIATRERVCS